MVLAYLLILSLGTILSLYIPKNEAVAKESIVIPGEAVRLRILANSDTEADQALKRKVRDAVNAQITLWVQDLTTFGKAKTVIRAKLPEIQTIAEQVVKDQGSKQSVKVEFGKVQFPTKLYGQFLYPAGEYQAVLITLGEGKGANWWCVLYPPLCFLDFSNGVAVSNDGFEEGKKAKAKQKVTKVETPAEQPDETLTNQPDENVEEALVNQSDEKIEETPAKENQKSSPAVVQKERKPVTNWAEPKKAETVKSPDPVVVSDESVAAEPTVEVASAPVKHVQKKKHKETPVYTADDEQPVKVKFFVVELWQKLF